MNEDLIADPVALARELRHAWQRMHGDLAWRPAPRLLTEAADALEAMQAEVNRLEAVLVRQKAAYEREIEIDVAALRAAAEKAREALSDLHANQDPADYFDALRALDEALGPR